MKKLLVVPFALLFAACAHTKGPMATATLDSTSGSTAKGVVHFQSAGDDGVEVVADLTGVPPGVHGFHVHNVTADDKGEVHARFTTHSITINTGANGVVGHAVVLHGNADDLVSQPAGNAGPRIACGVTTLVGMK